MKCIAFLFVTLLSITTIAADKGPFNDLAYARIIKAISDQCGYPENLVHVDTKESQQKVDQGIMDYFYESKFRFTVQIDQGAFDHYSANVQSALYAGYDHEAGVWGLFRVDSVQCYLQ